ncbi:hypothetical protein BGW37DRAFT_464037 [Umbelopsis sp. PMI_123]|nr:hypothetical protein BGW37DRAFT_464037 [Umbelopsis sp. PMI_123]
MDEKTPMLPAPAVSNCQCRCRSENKKKRVFRRIVLFLAGLFALHVFFHRYKSIRSDWNNDVSIQDCPPGRASIPWEGKTSYKVDPATFPSLRVFQNGSTTGGFVKTFSQSDDELAHIDVTIKFSEPDLQDEISVITDESETGYSLIVQTPNRLHRECIIVEIYVALPKSTLFTELEVGTVNSKIELIDEISTKEKTLLEAVNGAIFVKDLKTTDLEAKTVNGAIAVETAEAQTVLLHSVNGAIHADLDAEKINAETVNGAIGIKNIGDREVVGITTKTLNGATYVSAPQQFKGVFSIKTFLGKTSVISNSKSDKLHIENAGRRFVQGYYDSRNENSYITSETSLGAITLEFD